MQLRWTLLEYAGETCTHETFLRKCDHFMKSKMNWHTSVAFTGGMRKPGKSFPLWIPSPDIPSKRIFLLIFHTPSSSGSSKMYIPSRKHLHNMKPITRLIHSKLTHQFLIWNKKLHERLHSFQVLFKKTTYSVNHSMQKVAKYSTQWCVFTSHCYRTSRNNPHS